MKPKQPVKTKKRKKPLSKKESNVDNHELTNPICKQTLKESQIDWIACKLCAVWVHEDRSANEACFLCQQFHTNSLILHLSRDLSHKNRLHWQTSDTKTDFRHNILHFNVVP